jgi:hypothetical protein
MGTRRAALALVGLLAVLPSARAAGVPPVSVSPVQKTGSGLNFDRDIAPLLARRCLDCHSGAAPKGKLDLSRRKAALAQLIPGKPEESYLWQRVSDDEMPPKKPLPPAEKRLLRAWIAAGASWGSDPIDPFRITTATRAGYDWWSLQPLTRPVPPPVKNASWPITPSDRFLLARLEAKGLSPSLPAGKRTLIRRVTFDLIGLPPTPEEVEDFVGDSRPDAYERVVDRLLASPGYGERWGRHWLDVVRFGESDGFERDLPRFTAWPYRDLVVSALNRDLPYDEFARLQLAGDVLYPGDPDALAATGFLVAGAHDIVVPSSDNMKAAMRQDEMEDIVGTVAQTFLGMTVNCARCHDHKFDPISQRDYYRLASSLAGVGHGERTLAGKDKRLLLASLRQRLDRVREQLAALEEPVRQRLLKEKNKGRTAPPRPLAEWDFTTGLSDRQGRLHGKLQGGARQDTLGLRVDGRGAFVGTLAIAKDLREKTLEAWVRLDNLSQRGGGVMSVQTLDGQTFDAIVFGEQEPGRWMPGSNGFVRTRSLAGPVEKEADKRFVHVAITYGSDGTITAYRDGLPYGKPYRSTGPILFRAGEAQVVIGLRHGEPGGNRMLAGLVRGARLYDRALKAHEVAASAGVPHVAPEDIPPRLSPADRDKHRKWTLDLARLTGQIERLEKSPDRRLYAVVSFEPGVTNLLVRGNVAAKGEVVSPEVLTALAGRLPATGLKADTPEGQRRMALARWVTDANNGLFARVMVNRLWHHHFGAGLVETPNDLGFNGSRPSHPELLGWLASEMIRQRWSLKAMHRLMVLSAAYRQASRLRPEAAKLDSENRLLWRKSPARLEAEVVRDAMLHVSGALDRRMGGPPYLDFRTYFFKGTQFYDPVEQVGPAFTRRSLYRMWARGGRSPFLDTFDCPDPSTTTPKRATTTTPLQALTLFNNALVLHQSEVLAERLRREGGKSVDEQVQRAFLLAFGRSAEKAEMNLVIPFVRRHGLEAFCRVVLNSNEFVQVD